ncbi:MAG: flagellar filament capping protein FliD, partial [Armatimonadetes bacterium]|nr:flagellar filament capping protein FliD [Armatimonadota bacterium]
MSIGGSLSGISFTGLASGIDSASIVSQLIQIESFPIIRMQQQQIQLENRKSLFAQFQSLLVSFNSSASALNTAATFNPIKATSTDSDVATITATTNAVAGTYDLTVSKLARTHKVSSNAHAAADTALSYSGTFIVDGRAVAIDASDTLTTIAGKINTASSDVTASIIDGGAGNAYLTITSKLSGALNEVQIANLSGTALASLGFQTGAASFRDQFDADSVRSYGFSDSTTALSSLIGVSASGNFDIGTTTIAVDFATDSLQDIADAITNDVNSNATAIVVEVEENGKKVQKLEITGNSGLPVITDTDGLLEAIGVYERAYTNELVAAQDAEYTLDGFSFTSAKNAVTGVIPGSTLTLLKADVATPETTTLTLTKDVAKISESMEDLKNAYNTMIDFIRGVTAFDTESFQSGPLFGDPILAQAENSISSLLFTSVGTGTYTNLAQIGFSFDEDGKVELDTAALDLALSADTESVRRLMMVVGDST